MRRDELPGYRDNSDPFTPPAQRRSKSNPSRRAPLGAHRRLPDFWGVLLCEHALSLVRPRDGAGSSRRGGADADTVRSLDYWLAISAKPPSVPQKMTTRRAPVAGSPELEFGDLFNLLHPQMEGLDRFLRSSSTSLSRKSVTWWSTASTLRANGSAFVGFFSGWRGPQEVDFRPRPGRRGGGKWSTWPPWCTMTSWMARICAGTAPLRPAAMAVMRPSCSVTRCWPTPCIWRPNFRLPEICRIVSDATRRCVRARSRRRCGGVTLPSRWRITGASSI